MRSASTTSPHPVQLLVLLCLQVCRAFAATGSCVYGTRCRFIHGHASAPNNLADPAASALLAATLLSHTTGGGMGGDLAGGMEGVRSLDDPGVSRLGARRVGALVVVCTICFLVLCEPGPTAYFPNR
jgi:hypothetical protein